MEIIVNGSLPKEEIEEYKKYILDKHPQVKSATITVDGDYVDFDYDIPEIHFDRVRRITGYLVGTVDRWNDAKKAELKDRVKHQKV